MGNLVQCCTGISLFFQVDAATLEFEDLLLEALGDREGYPRGLDSRANVQRRYARPLKKQTCS